MVLAFKRHLQNLLAFESEDFIIK